MNKIIKVFRIVLLNIFLLLPVSCSNNTTSDNTPDFIPNISTSVPPTSSNNTSSSEQTKEEFNLIVVERYQGAFTLKLGEDFKPEERVIVYRQYYGKRSDIKRSEELPYVGRHTPNEDPTTGYTILTNYDKDDKKQEIFSFTVYYNNPYEDIKVTNNGLVSLLKRGK